MILPARYDRLTPSQRKKAREIYTARQGGVCTHCNRPLNGPPSRQIRLAKINWSLFPLGFLKHPVHLHHDHRTGMTIGAVHSRCNAVLWQFHGE